MAIREHLIKGAYTQLQADMGVAMDRFIGQAANQDATEAVRSAVVNILSEYYDKQEFDVTVKPDPNDPSKMNVTTKLYGEDDKPSELERVGKIVEEVLAGR